MRQQSSSILVSSAENVAQLTKELELMVDKGAIRLQSCAWTVLYEGGLWWANGVGIANPQHVAEIMLEHKLNTH